MCKNLIKLMPYLSWIPIQISSDYAPGRRCLHIMPQYPEIQYGSSIPINYDFFCSHFIYRVKEFRYPGFVEFPVFLYVTVGKNLGGGKYTFHSFCCWQQPLSWSSRQWFLLSVVTVFGFVNFISFFWFLSS